MPRAHENKNEHKQGEEKTAKNLLTPELHW
jgi:hypothetical protein